MKRYFILTKPGIVAGNALAAIGGFALASQGHIDVTLFFLMLVGISLVVASGCVFNNYIDKDIDAKMQRTMRRGLVVQAISDRNGIVFGSVLFASGFTLLFAGTNVLAASVAAFGFFVYVVVYSLWAKRTTPYATEIGSVAGAVPLIVGYTAAANTLDIGAVLLFFILAFWQMPHFFAISLRRMDEYAAASIPVLPLTKGIYATKVRMVIYIILYSIAVVLLAVFGYVGALYLVVMVPLSLVWLWRTLTGFREQETKQWARKTFLFSLVMLVTFALMISIDSFVR